MQHTTKQNGNQPQVNADERKFPDRLDPRVSASIRGHPCAPQLTPLELLHAALSASALASRTLQKFPTDPASEIHGNLIVALGALRRAAEATAALLAVEEGGENAARR